MQVLSFAPFLPFLLSFARPRVADIARSQSQAAVPFVTSPPHGQFIEPQPLGGKVV